MQQLFIIVFAKQEFAYKLMQSEIINKYLIIFDNLVQILFTSGLFFDRHKLRSINASSFGSPANSASFIIVASEGSALPLRKYETVALFMFNSLAKLLYPVKPYLSIAFSAYSLNVLIITPIYTLHIHAVYNINILV